MTADPNNDSMFKGEAPWSFDKAAFTLGLSTGLIAAVKDGGRLDTDQQGLARRSLGDLSRLYEWLIEHHQRGELRDGPPPPHAADGTDGREELHLT